MTAARILSGQDEADDIHQRLQVEVASLGSTTYQPGLAIIQVGNRRDSNVDINMKIKAAQEIGIQVKHLQLPR